MPNHVLNLLKVSGDKAEVDALIARMTTTESAFDVNAILPMPECIRDTQTGGREIDGERVEQWQETEVPEGTEGAAKRYDGKWSICTKITEQENQRRRAEYGATNWYDWAIEHWGTKWSAYSIGQWQREDDYSARIEFTTAWGSCEPVIEALAQEFKSLHFVVHCDGEVDEPFSYQRGPVQR